MKLDRPLVMLDLETTGIETSTARIVQMGFIKLRIDGTQSPWVVLVNPVIPIPAEATAIHGVDDEAVSDSRTFREMAAGIKGALEDCDLGGFNVRRYDLPVLLAEFARAGVPFSLEGRNIIDTMAIYHQREPRDLSAAVRFYTGREMEDAHDALADARASFDVLQGQLGRYDDLPGDMAALHEICAGDAIDLEGKFKWEGAEAVISFGKHKGKSLNWLASERGFLDWMLRSDFPEDAKHLAREAISGRFPTRTP